VRKYLDVFSHRRAVHLVLQLVDQFKDFTHSADDAQATQMLEWHGWSLDRAVVSEHTFLHRTLPKCSIVTTFHLV
jgi:UBA-like domain